MRFILITARDRQPQGALALGPARIIMSFKFNVSKWPGASYRRGLAIPAHGPWPADSPSGLALAVAGLMLWC